MPSKRIKKCNILYTLYSKEMAKVSRELSQTMLAKTTQDTQTQLPSGLRITASETVALAPVRHWLSLRLAYTRTQHKKIPFSFYQGLQEGLG